MTKHEIDLLFGGGLVGFGIGCTGMYFVCRQQLKTKYATIADEEIQSVKDHYREKEMELLELQKEISSQPKPDLDALIEREGYAPKSVEEAVEELRAEEQEEAEEIGVAAFTQLPPWDHARQMAERTREVPYVIHKEEFFADDSYDHSVTWTYFEGDDVLVDESDEVITKKDEVVGLDNLTKFGHGSEDPNVVYIRNDRLQQDMEILLHKSHYAKEVLGLEEEPTDLKHSAYRTRRFDDDDG
jgi:hypothetical protein